MNYIITNNKQYIKLGENGIPVTCGKQEAQRFENSKARNILDNLPKTLRKFNFRIKPVSEVQSKINKNILPEMEKNIIKENVDYEVTDNIVQWLDKFGKCSDVLDEAKDRQKFLIRQLDNTDNELLDILHIIELESPKNMYQGWLLYKKIKTNRRYRRYIKDEINIIQNVLEKVDAALFSRARIQRAIDGLFKRRYRFRIVDEEEEKNVV